MSIYCITVVPASCHPARNGVCASLFFFFLLDSPYFHTSIRPSPICVQWCTGLPCCGCTSFFLYILASSKGPNISNDVATRYTRR
ncbi:hypothetical protein GALMADRAFT_453080 [Galerina marginata CBS 339.88]|uniref:Uncharacterized protein n=1 Tax=Galerina marginata (strain CBS 339.88) TaxID=685588 RepID=A0A067T0G2_GALM3|nr:hypothetical protein GALMADRAFT_453080 [Galerina marginata CBS 339.88]